MEKDKLPTLHLRLKKCLEFVRPYVEREFQGLYTVSAAGPDTAPAPGDILVEVMEIGDRTPQGWTLPQIAIQCPWVIGTGMQGTPRRIAAGVKRGSYHHLKGNESTRHAVIHAVDVAQALRVAVTTGLNGVFVATDGTNPPVNAIAEAIAYRMGHKRLFTMKHFLGRLLMGALYDEVTEDRPAETSAELLNAGFTPVSTVDYLKTHVYDEDSL